MQELDPQIPPEELSKIAQHYGLESVETHSREYSEVVNMILQASGGMPPLAPSQATRAESFRRPIAKEDPLNAIVHWCKVASTTSGILDGLTITVKDSIAVAGVPQTAGFSGLANHIPSEHATIVGRLLSNGASINATTNMDAFGMAATGESSSYGRTLNPIDHNRLSGGSSSGAAASLTYLEVDAAIGTDQGGSIRIPASWSGCIGLKPTFGLVPYTGIAGIDQSLDHVGPLTRDTVTMSKILQVTAGYDPGDPRQRPRQIDDYVSNLDRLASGFAGLRIGVVAEGFASGRSEELATSTATRAAIERIRSLGATVTDVSIPVFKETGGIGMTISLEGMAAILRDNGQNYGLSGQYDPEFVNSLKKALNSSIEELSPQLKVALLAGTYMHETWGGERYARARRLQPTVGAAFEQIFKEFDVLAMPATPYSAPFPYTGNKVDEMIKASWDNLRNTLPFNVSGHPSISLPLAEVDGLPVGVMFTAPYFRDDLLLQVSHACEHILGWQGTPTKVAR